MPHIALSDRPAIRALFNFRPETAKPPCDLDMAKHIVANGYVGIR
jgi:hypothetical protein